VVAVLVAAGAGGAAFGGVHTASAGAAVVTSRLAGADRYATAAAVSEATFPSGAPVAYLATGLDYPDALTAAAAAGGKGPVLLAGPGGLTVPTAAELSRLHPARITVVGGDLAISGATLAAVSTAAPSATVTRVSGSDRFTTAALLSRATFPAGAPIAYVATGTDYPDALAAAAASGGKGPVLLVGPGGVPSATATELTRLAPGRVIVVGGTLAIPSSTKAAIESLLPSADVMRAAGPDRFATAADLSSFTFPNGAPIAYLATGADFPDALTAAAASGGRGPVLLALADQAPAPTVTEVQRLLPGQVVLVGGTSAVSDAAAAEVLPAPATTPTSTPGPSTTIFTAGPPPPPSSTAGVAVQTAEAQIGKPYLYGGAGPASFDCSGLTMYAWAPAGVTLPHNAAAQAALLAPVRPDTADLMPGDLVFYDTPIDHVAMYVGNGQMVEAAHTGVPVRLTPFRTESLVGAGRPERP
jgi:cell wall-associated NlpC family hydrolase